MISIFPLTFSCRVAYTSTAKPLNNLKTITDDVNITLPDFFIRDFKCLYQNQLTHTAFWCCRLASLASSLSWLVGNNRTCKEHKLPNSHRFSMFWCMKLLLGKYGLAEKRHFGAPDKKIPWGVPQKLFSWRSVIFRSVSTLQKCMPRPRPRIWAHLYI